MFGQRFSGKRRLLTLALTLGFSLTLALPLTASAHSRNGDHSFFKQTNLVADQPGQARHTDPNLVNSWGIVAVPDGPFWIADNGADVATAYNGNGHRVRMPIMIPPPTGSPAGTAAAPTGIVFNRTDDFVVSQDEKSGPAQLLFSTEDGTISGWNPKVNRNMAIIEVNNTNLTTGPVYKGLAQGKVGSRDFLYATNFRFGTIDVFDAHFIQQSATNFPFSDPNIPAGFAPFGIRNIGGKLYVTYARQDDAKHDDVAGPGNGFVDVFDTSGNLQGRFASQGPLDSPWGLALAPDDFGRFSHALLVGNFGDHMNTGVGSINAFDFRTGMFLGSLTDKNGTPIFIDGLWGLTFGDDVRAADSDDLYFTAGPNGEANGLFGFLSRED